MDVDSEVPIGVCFHVLAAKLAGLEDGFAVVDDQLIFVTVVDPEDGLLVMEHGVDGFGAGGFEDVDDQVERVERQRTAERAARPFERLGPNLWYTSLHLPLNTYLEYAFFDEESRERIPDPLNPTWGTRIWQAIP